MKRNPSLAGLVLAAALLCGCIVSASETRIMDIETGREMPLSDLLPELKKNRILFVGEVHDQQAHHEVQLSIIRALHESGTKVAIGMEMFRKDSQADLDRWVEGEITLKDFRPVYDDNWNFPWPLYGGILTYAREKRIPVVGLNVSKGITRQVARSGFQSLDGRQKEALPMVTCHVDEKYMHFIKESFGLHGHGRLNLTYFCEAQLVWDKSMAVHALEYLFSRPESLMVVVTGKGHAQKMGIPAQIRKRSSLPLTVMLPQLPESLVSGPQGRDDADYLFRSP
ncbi:ChaN family lipoprotein [Desulfococcus sp.]|uniref:ChaN family lipoprotein n=1 Tax=Desulfococcus sp. TaxID=2025834 RepID=UPI0035937503